VDLQHVIINNLNRLENWQQKKLVVGYSGGLDSTVLLSLVASLKNNFPELNIAAIHVNHNLMEQCDLWQQHCEKFCEAIQVPFNSIKITSLTSSGKGIEDAARQARFGIFEKYINEDELLLLAHHANDQTETIIYRLMRGSGVVGLSGIKQIQALKKLTIIRPLLTVEKTELEQYAISNKIKWIDDNSNSDENYDRNYIRKNVISVLENRWPDLHQKLTKNSKLLEQQAELLDELAVEDSKIIVSNSGYLELDQLRKINPKRCLNFLSWWFRQNIGYSLSNTRIKLIYNDLKNYRNEASFKQNCGGSVLLQSRNRAYLIPHSFFSETYEVLFLNEFLPEHWQQIIEIGLSKYISISLKFKSNNDFDTIKKMNLEISFGVANGKVKFSHKQNSCELRKLFQQQNVPSWLKPCWPILTSKGSMASVVGFGHLQPFADGLKDVRTGCSIIWGNDRHFKI